jgi:hypothetical protein
MKVVMIRSNAFVPDIRLKRNVLVYLKMAKTYLRSNKIVLRTITVKNGKNHYQVRRIRFKAHQGFFYESELFCLGFVQSNTLRRIKKITDKK